MLLEIYLLTICQTDISKRDFLQKFFLRISNISKRRCSFLLVFEVHSSHLIIVCLCYFFFLFFFLKSQFSEWRTIFPNIVVVNFQLFLWTNREFFLNAVNIKRANIREHVVLNFNLPQHTKKTSILNNLCSLSPTTLSTSLQVKFIVKFNFAIPSSLYTHHQINSHIIFLEMRLLKLEMIVHVLNLITWY